MFKLLNDGFRSINQHLKLFFFITFGIVMSYIIIDSIALCTSGNTGVFMGVLNLVFMSALMVVYLIGVLKDNIRAIGLAGISVCTFYLFYQIYRTSQMIVFFGFQNGIIYTYFSFEFIQLMVYMAALVFFTLAFIGHFRFCRNMARLLYLIGIFLGVIVYPSAIAAATEFSPVMTGTIWYLYITPFLFMFATLLFPITIDFLGFFDDLYKARKIKKIIYEDEEATKEEAKEEVVDSPVDEIKEPKEEVKKEAKEPIEE